MLVDVVQLRRAGLKLRDGELKPPERGNLVFEDNDGRQMAYKRPTRTAEVLRYIGSPGTPQTVIQPLHDAQVIKIEGAVITIIGTETHAVDGRRAAEHVKIWRCTVVRE